MKKLLLAIVITGLTATLSLRATPFNVQYTATTIAGGQVVLDFYVTNNLTADPAQNLFLFGMNYSIGTITGSPSNFVANAPFDFSTVYSFPFFGGYEIWVDPNRSDNLQLPGTTTSLFEVTLPGGPPPSSIGFVAITTDNGIASSNIFDGYINDPSLAVTEGVASRFSGPAAPEPATLLLVCAGLAGIAAFSKRKIA
jgi:hypothetical protein